MPSKMIPQEMADVQKAMFEWCALSLAAYKGEEVPDEVLEHAAMNLEEAMFDLPGHRFSGNA